LAKTRVVARAGDAASISAMVWIKLTMRRPEGAIKPTGR
jgi:hypothetical protein